MNRWWTLALLGVSVACSDESGPVAPVDLLPESVPVAQLSIGFGDPPLSGLLRFAPAPDGTTGWRFRIEVDGGGTTPREGFVAAGPAMAFRFEEPGVHELAIHLERGNQRTTVTKQVVVNAPGAARIASESVVVTEDTHRDLEGIAYLSSGKDHLFVTRPDANEILRIDPASMMVEAVLNLPQGTHLQDPLGVALSHDQAELYIASETRYLLTVSVPEMELIATMPVGSSDIDTQIHVELQSPNRVVLGGRGGVVVFDTDAGEVIRERVITGAQLFTLSPDGSTIALIQYLEDRTAVWLLDASTLAERAVIPLPDLMAIRGSTIDFKPDGSRLYLMGSVGVPGQRRLHFYVIDAASFEILTDFPMGPCDSCMDNISNPTATSADGRYVLFPGLDSSYVVDTGLDLPIYRTPARGWSVAASTSGHEFFLTGPLGTITKVVVDP